MIVVLPLLTGTVLDKLLGDPVWLPHPVVGFGKLISFFEHRWNRGRHRRLKGAVLAVSLVTGTFFVVLAMAVAAYRISPWLYVVLARNFGRESERRGHRSALLVSDRWYSRYDDL